MKSVYFILLFFIFFISSCYQTIDKPSDLIDKDVMIQILSDFYIYKQIQIETYGIKKNKNEINKFVLRKHGVTPLQYKNSFNYYYLDNQVMVELHQEVKKKLRKEINKLKMLEE